MLRTVSSPSVSERPRKFGASPCRAGADFAAENFHRRRRNFDSVDRFHKLRHGTKQPNLLGDENLCLHPSILLQAAQKYCPMSERTNYRPTISRATTAALYCDISPGVCIGKKTCFKLCLVLWAGSDMQRVHKSKSGNLVSSAPQDIGI